MCRLFEKIVVVSMVVIFILIVCFCLLIEENRELKAENRRIRRKVREYALYGYCESSEKR